MVESNGIARELSNIDKIMDSVINIDAKIRDAIWRRKARSILERLRELYFHQDGTLKFLRMIANGEPVQQSVLDKVRSTFQQQDYAAAEAIRDLKEKCAFHNINLTLDDAQLIETVLYQ